MESKDSPSTIKVVINDNDIISHVKAEDAVELNDRSHDDEQQLNQQILSSSSSQTSSSMSTIHYLPCKIHYNVPTDVNNYFQITKTNNNNKHELKSAFRGRELIGKEVLLSANNIIGIHAVQHPPKEKCEMIWEVVGSYDKITMWQHDIAPDLSTLNHAIEWFDIANQV